MQHTTVSEAKIEGTFDPAFRPVRDAFADNFNRGEEVGAHCAVYVGGKLVVDVWGGHTDRTQAHAWEQDTIVNMMSVAKGISSLVVHMLADRGMIDLDAPVIRYWPEYGQAGKEGTLVRHLLDHRAGLEYLEDPLWPGAIYDWNVMVGALERQAPLHEPGTYPAYHTITMSFLVGELLRRVTGKNCGRLLRELITGPLGADYHLGLPLPQHRRCARFLRWAGYAEKGHGRDEPSDLLVKAWAQLDPKRDDDLNSEQFRLAELPAANGHGSARAVARIYAELAAGGGSLISSAALKRATEMQWFAVEPILTHHYRMGLGFTLNSPDAYMGPNEKAFGHVGAGGSTGFCDPVAKVAFSYGMNLMRENRDNGPRARRLLDALYTCL